MLEEGLTSLQESAEGQKDRERGVALHYASANKKRVNRYTSHAGFLSSAQQ